MIGIAYFGFFLSWHQRAICQILGGGVEYDMIQHIATRTRDAFVFGSYFGHLVSGILMTDSCFTCGI